MIYITCIANYATGGTELLHQLYFELSKFSDDIRMYYLPANKNPINERFKKYNVKYVTKIDDNINNLMVVPEIYTGELKKYKNIKKAIWWLSVDFYYKSSLGLSSTNIQFLYIFKRILIGDYFRRIVKFNDKNIIHFYQSEYAKNFLISKKVASLYSLSDYLGENFINVTEESLNYSIRLDTILYNPMKGIKVTNEIREKMKDLNFVAIENMNPEQIGNLMQTSKIYIDFGFHPGKDRIPREAAMMGCIVITNKDGAALNNIDIPIPEKYKFDDPVEKVDEIKTLFNSIFNDYNKHYLEFTKYREKIMKEKDNFVCEVDYLWNSIFQYYV